MSPREEGRRGRVPRESPFLLASGLPLCSSSPPISAHRRFALDLPLLPFFPNLLLSFFFPTSPVSILLFPTRDSLILFAISFRSVSIGNCSQLLQVHSRRVSPVSPQLSVHITIASSPCRSARVASTTAFRHDELQVHIYPDSMRLLPCSLSSLLAADMTQKHMLRAHRWTVLANLSRAQCSPLMTELLCDSLQPTGAPPHSL